MKHSFLVVIVMILAAAQAWGSIGGPALAKPLGWDPHEQKVFASITYFDESGAPDEIVYFDLRGPAPRKPVVAKWSLDRAGYEIKLAALRRRLLPLAPSLVQAIPSSTTIVKADSVGDQDRRARYRIRIAAPRFYHLELTTFHRPLAALASLWAIPGRREKLLIVSSIGPDPESAYEVQTPVLLSGTSDDLVSVESIPHP